MKQLIFDFDGTMADSLELAVAIYRELVGRDEPFTAEEFARLRKLPLHKVAKAVGIPLWKTPFLLWRGRKLMHARIDEIEIFKDLIPVIVELHQRGYVLRIVSSNSKENIASFLKRYELGGYFEDIIGNAGLLRKDKVLNQVIRRAGLDKKDVCYIGDEARDITASHRAGINVVSVAWGYNDVALLRSLKPHAVAEKPADLLKVFN